MLPRREPVRGRPHKVRYLRIDREVMVLRDGLEVTFRRWGSGLGTPVLLLHGLGCNADDWDAAPQVRAMAGRPATFFAPDLPSARPSPVGQPRPAWDAVHLPDLAPLLAEFADRLGLHGYGVIGHSLGAVPAAHLTLTDRQAAWCVLGGLGLSLWQPEGRLALAEILRRRRRATPDDAELLDFLGTRCLDLEALATTIVGALPRVGDLRAIAGGVRVLATREDHSDAEALSDGAAWGRVDELPGDHVSSFLSGGFLEAALEWRLPRRETHDAEAFVVALSGLPGSGKTSVAVALADRFDAEHLSSDRLRHSLVEVPAYTDEESAVVRAEMRVQALSTAGGN